MKATRSRRILAVFALLAVLFTQLAVSAYACPGMDGMKAAMVVAEEAPPCHQNPAPESRTPLCQAHCQQGDQSLDLRGVTLAPACLVALPVSWRPLESEAPPSEAATQVSLLERPTGPPLAVRHCRFRI